MTNQQRRENRFQRRKLQRKNKQLIQKQIKKDLPITIRRPLPIVFLYISSDEKIDNCPQEVLKNWFRIV